MGFKGEIKGASKLSATWTSARRRVESCNRRWLEKKPEAEDIPKCPCTHIGSTFKAKVYILYGHMDAPGLWI